MLTFFEPPHWCRNASNLVGDESKYYDLTASINKQYGDCKTLFDAHGATSSGDEGNQQLYPSTNAMLLTIRESKFLELTCVGVISFYLMFTFGDDGFDPHFFFYPGYKRWIHATQSLVLVMLLMSAIFDNTLFNPFFRVLILGSFLKSFQREMWTFLTMVRGDFSHNDFQKDHLLISILAVLKDTQNDHSPIIASHCCSILRVVRGSHIL